MCIFALRKDKLFREVTHLEPYDIPKNMLVRIFLLLLLLLEWGDRNLIMAQEKYEIRATWLTTLGGLDWPSSKASSPAGIERQKKELCGILDQLKEAHFNTVLLQTRLRGDVIYPSAIEPFTESLTGHEGGNPKYDPLQFAIEECHRRGLEVHAWIVTIPIGNQRQVKLLGKNSVVRKKPELCKLYKGTWYLDPGNPGTDDYLASIVREVVSKYDVDGVHFDYIRYPEHSPNFPDEATYRKYGHKQDDALWRRSNITRIVRRLYHETKALKPWVKVSSSPVGKYNDTQRYTSRGWNAYEIVYQDAQGWMKEGIQDALFPMMYFQGNNFYPFALDWQENKHGRWVVPGLGIYFLHPKEQNWEVGEVIRQIHFLKDVHIDGQAYFRNRFLLDNTKGLLTRIKQEFYQTPAAVPPMKWQDSIPPLPPIEPQFAALPQGVQLGWKAQLQDEPSYLTYRIYASNQYPVDIHLGENLVEIRIDSTIYTHHPEFPWQERAYWSVTAVDRFGNESAPLELNQPVFKVLEKESTKSSAENDGSKQIFR